MLPLAVSHKRPAGNYTVDMRMVHKIIGGGFSRFLKNPLTSISPSIFIQLKRILENKIILYIKLIYVKNQ
jgi:hypothetical protein